MDLGAAFLRQPGLAGTSVLTLAGQLAYTTATYALASNGVLAVTPQDRYTGQGVFTASRYAPAARRLRWEVTGMTSAFGLSGVAPSYAWQAVAREHASWSLGGVFAGVGAGQIAQHGVAATIETAQAGGFLRIDPLGRDELSTAFAYTAAGRPIAGAARARYMDVVGYWSHRGEWIEASLGVGVRSDLPSDSLVGSWASGTAALWLSRRAALVVSAGRALADESRGVPSVRYLSLAVRFGWRPTRAAGALRVRQRPAEDDAGRLDVRGGGDSLRVVIVRSTAARVEIVGDFTDWEPVPMTSMPNGEWRLERNIPPGPHRVAIRVDGGPWRVPPNLPRVADDFGGEVGIVTVP